jgi:hypothetical protein
MVWKSTVLEVANEAAISDVRDSQRGNSIDRMMCACAHLRREFPHRSAPGSPYLDSMTVDVQFTKADRGLGKAIRNRGFLAYTGVKRTSEIFI